MSGMLKPGLYNTSRTFLCNLCRSYITTLTICAAGKICLESQHINDLKVVDIDYLIKKIYMPSQNDIIIIRYFRNGFVKT